MTGIVFSILYSLPGIPAPNLIEYFAIMILDFMPFEDWFSESFSEPRYVENIPKINWRMLPSDVRWCEHWNDGNAIRDKAKVNEICLYRQGGIQDLQGCIRQLGKDLHRS